MQGQLSIFDIMPDNAAEKTCFNCRLGGKVYGYDDLMACFNMESPCWGNNWHSEQQRPACACWQKDYGDINILSEQEAVERIGEALGLKFVYSSFFEEWIAKVGKLQLTAHYSHYATDDENVDGALFLGVGWDNKKDNSGGGAPCDTLNDAIDKLKIVIERYKEDTK